MTALHRMGRPAPIQPRYQTRPYRMHPGRREHIYGRLQPMDREDRWPIWTKIVVIGGAILAAYVTINGGKF